MPYISDLPAPLLGLCFTYIANDDSAWRADNCKSWLLLRLVCKCWNICLESVVRTLTISSKNLSSCNYTIALQRQNFFRLKKIILIFNTIENIDFSYPEILNCFTALEHISVMSPNQISIDILIKINDEENYIQG